MSTDGTEKAADAVAGGLYDGRNVFEPKTHQRERKATDDRSRRFSSSEQTN